VKHTATATEHNREPSRLLRDAKRGIVTEITDHGRAVAALVPQPEVTSGDELARRLAKRKPEPETAAAIAKLIRGLDEAA
jgi:antitoxin (DNA-binding transcriptional repressor) of toxin-antitoxin stability system